MANTHFSKLAGKIVQRTNDPVDPENGQMYYNTLDNSIKIYLSSAGKWYGFPFDTSTSTSTSTTTTSTSTSTTTTSTSTSSTTSTTTTTSTSTSTTL